MRQIILISLALLSLSASAEIYETTGANGERVFSDRPTEDSKVIEFKGASTYKPPKYRRFSPSNTAGETAPFSYKAISISQPVNDSTLFDSDGAVNVAVKLDPALRNTDRVQLYLDGKAIGKPMQTSRFSLTIEDRGAHTLRADVQNSKDKVVSHSDAIKFFYRKHSVLFKKPN